MFIFTYPGQKECQHSDYGKHVYSDDSVFCDNCQMLEDFDFMQ